MQKFDGTIGLFYCLYSNNVKSYTACAIIIPTVSLIPQN